MTPIISEEARLWSNCSRRYVLEYLKRKDDECLFY